MRSMRAFSLLMPGATVLGLRSDTTVYMWIRHAKYTAKEALRAHALADTTDPQWTYALAVQSWPSVIIKEINTGAYNVQWFDPQRATWIQSQVFSSSSDGLVLDMPDFAYDMAVKITHHD